MNTKEFIELAPRISSESDKTRPALHSFFRYDGHLIATDGRIALAVALDDHTVEPAIDSQEIIGRSLLCDILPKLDRQIEDGQYKPFDLNLANSAAAAAMGDLIYDADWLMRVDDEDEDEIEHDEPNRFSLLINTLFELYGVPVEHVAQEICPNFTRCADCHIDDFCHVCDDDGVVICEIAQQARKLAAKYRKLYGIKAKED